MRVFARCLVLLPLCVLTACAGTSAARRAPLSVEAPVEDAAPVAEAVAPPAPEVEAPPPPMGLSAEEVLALAMREGRAVDGAMLPVPLLAPRAFDVALDSARLVVEPVRTVVRHWEWLLAPSRTAALILERAVQLVGEKNVSRWDRGVPNDCSGFVRVAYSQAGINLVRGGFLAGENAVSGIFRLAEQLGAVHQRAPRPGDLVFFRETYDRNRDGKRNDGMTHIGVVEQVELDGTVTFIHRGGKGVSRSRMNLERPTVFREGHDGPVLNDYLRPRSKRERAYLTGELFVAYASVDGL